MRQPGGVFAYRINVICIILMVVKRVLVLKMIPTAGMPFSCYSAEHVGRCVALYRGELVKRP